MHQTSKSTCFRMPAEAVVSVPWVPMSQFFSDKYRKHHGQETTKTLEKDLHCKACGYNLRGLKLRDACPECGLPIRDSGTPDPVKLEPEYLERIRSSLLFVIPAWALMVLPWPFWVFDFFPGFAGLAAAVGSGLGMIGVVMATTLRPDEADRYRSFWNLRTILRGAATMAALFTLGAVVLSYVGRVPWIREVAVLNWFIAQGMFCMVASRLARDVHDDPLASRLWGLSFFNFIVSPIGTYIGAVTVSINSWSCMGGLLAPLAVLVGQVAFAWSCWHLSRSYAWSLRYQDTMADRTQRLKARMEAARARGPAS